MGGPQGKPWVPAVDQREVHEFFERTPQRLRRVIARMIWSKRYLHAPQGPQIGFKEAWDTSRQRHPSGECISNFGSAGDPKYATLHAPPEFLHTRKSVFHLVPRDKTRIDGADRGADDPV